MSQPLSSLNREERWDEIQGNVYDVLVIGGGITGAGIALDATVRGMSTVLFEMQDFAAGTSSRSTKLVHGGLRYLKQFEVKMVAEVGKERAIVYENGPHVTTPEWMLLPIYAGGTFGKLSTAIGLKVYDYLAGVKRSERRKMLSRQETLNREPLLKNDGLKGGGYYVEYRTDDARLTLEVMKEAAGRGAVAMNYAKVDGFIYDNGRVAGVRVIDQLTGHTYEARAKKVINASGPWVDSLREKDGSKQGKTLQHTKGVHLVIDQKKFPLRQAVYFDTPDGRMVFAIPRDGKAYIGTTDTVYAEDLTSPRMTEADRSYLLKCMQFMFPGVQLSEKDIESSWAGVRPLIREDGKKPSEISRKDEIWESASGLVTIAGGKLTGYRKMAEMVVDQVAVSLQRETGVSYPPCATKSMTISGGDVGGSAGFSAYVKNMAAQGVRSGLTIEQASRLSRFYGSNAGRLFEIAESCHAVENAHPGLPGLPRDILATVIYAIEEEGAAKPEDYFIRRTGALLFDMAWVQRWKEPVIDWMGELLGWTEERKERYAQELEQHLERAVVPAQ